MPHRETSHCKRYRLKMNDSNSDIYSLRLSLIDSARFDVNLGGKQEGSHCVGSLYDSVGAKILTTWNIATFKHRNRYFKFQPKRTSYDCSICQNVNHWIQSIRLNLVRWLGNQMKIVAHPELHSVITSHFVCYNKERDQVQFTYVFFTIRTRYACNVICVVTKLGI